MVLKGEKRLGANFAINSMFGVGVEDTGIYRTIAYPMFSISDLTLHHIRLDFITWLTC